MRKNIVTTDFNTGKMTICKAALESLKTNGTFLPDIIRVVFNLKTTDKVPVKNDDGTVKTEPAVNKDGTPVVKKDGKPVMKTVYETVQLDKPILVTKVWWEDNTTTTVRNSANDPITTETVTLENGTTVTVASESSKTIGIMAAVTKRTCGVPGPNGEMVDTNMGKILSDIVDHAFDQQIEDAKSKIYKANKKANAQRAKEKANAPKPKKYSQQQLLQLLGPILEKLAENPDVIINALKEKTNVSQPVQDQTEQNQPA